MSRPDSREVTVLGRPGPTRRLDAPLTVRTAAGLPLVVELGGAAEVARHAEVDERGACAPPDGVARLVRSLLTAYADEADAHAHGRCRMSSAAQR